MIGRGVHGCAGLAYCWAWSLTPDLLRAGRIREGGRLSATRRGHGLPRCGPIGRNEPGLSMT